RCGRLLGGERRGRSPGHNDVDWERSQLRRQRRVEVVPPLGEARLEPEIAPFDVAVLRQLAEESLQRRQRRGAQHADAHAFRRLLCPRCKRPNRRRAAEQRDEVATPEESCHPIPPAEGWYGPTIAQSVAAF